MWKKLSFIFLIILLAFYVYFGISVNLYLTSSSSKESINENIGKGIINNSFDYVVDERKIEGNYTSDIIGYLKIDKIKLYKELYSISSPENTVEKNIQILGDSAMPDVAGGNFILVAHSGFSSVAFFHNLNRLEIGDKINIFYNEKNYDYTVEKIYDVSKTGKVILKRDKNRSAVTLITCLDNDKQIVVIGYLN